MEEPLLAGQFRFVREFGGELIILDDRHDVAHRLDAEAAAVWRACDGSGGPASVARRTGLGPARVADLLGELAERGLLAGHGATRRAVLRKAVLTGAALTAISSVVVPTPAEAFESRPIADMSSTGPSQPGEPLQASSTGSGGDPAAGVQGSSGAPQRVGGRPGARRPTGPQLAGANDRIGVPGAGDVPGVAGGAVRGVPRGTLPFTGSNVVGMAAVGTGLIVAGAAARAAAGPAEPAP